MPEKECSLLYSQILVKLCAKIRLMISCTNRMFHKKALRRTVSVFLASSITVKLLKTTYVVMVINQFFIF